VEESTLRQSVVTISATGSPTQQSVTVTAQGEPPDKCALQQDALKETLVRLKALTKEMMDREEAWYRCKYGISLSSTEPISGPAFSSATTLRGATGAIFIQLERLAIATGIKIE
jgi:hypothetical protein